MTSRVNDQKRNMERMKTSENIEREWKTPDERSLVDGQMLLFDSLSVVLDDDGMSR